MQEVLGEPVVTTMRPDASASLGGCGSERRKDRKKEKKAKKEKKEKKRKRDGSAEEGTR